MKISKTGFFSNNEVMFIGLSSNPKSFSRSVYKDFIKSGINVTPVNKRKFTIEGNKVYASVEELTKMPSTAYILLNKRNTTTAFDALKKTGIKKILFHSQSTVETEILNECSKLGIEAVVACPKMMISNAPIHKLHGFIAGIRK